MAWNVGVWSETERGALRDELVRTPASDVAARNHSDVLDKAKMSTSTLMKEVLQRVGIPRDLLMEKTSWDILEVRSQRTS